MQGKYNMLLDQGGKSSQHSHRLSNKELRELYNAKGKMPSYTSTPNPAGADRGEVQRRIKELDVELDKRIASIATRFNEREMAIKMLQERKGGMVPLKGMGQFFKLGVVGELLPELVFFCTYSMAVAVYADQNDWNLRWSATNQDSIYYPAVVLAFLLCFRASFCMDRYQAGLLASFEMEKSLREAAFEVVTKLSVEEEDFGAPAAPAAPAQPAQAEKKGRPIPTSMKKRYFTHEFRRMTSLLFCCAARDLNDSALEDEELSEEDAERLQCSATEVEHSAIRVTHSAFGHAFRVYLVAAWLLKLVQKTQEEGLFDAPNVYDMAEQKLARFKEAWLDGRQVAYSSMPSSVTHILVLLTTVMNLFMPFELVNICRYGTWLPSCLLVISFYGVLKIASAMENPFGFDADDIPLWQVADHLDEEVCLIIHYSVLDEVGGENLYRAMMGQDMFVLGDTQQPSNHV